MIKGKTKVLSGFRSNDGGIMFGNTMSILKTSKLRSLNILNCVSKIFNGNALFAKFLHEKQSIIVQIGYFNAE